MTVNDTDKFLVNRSGSSYHLEAQNLMAELQDDDLMLVNRSGKSYKATGAEIKESLKPPAEVIKPQIIAPADGAGQGVEIETDIITEVSSTTPTTYKYWLGGVVDSKWSEFATAGNGYPQPNEANVGDAGTGTYGKVYHVDCGTPGGKFGLKPGLNNNTDYGEVLIFVSDDGVNYRLQQTVPGGDQNLKDIILTARYGRISRNGDFGPQYWGIWNAGTVDYLGFASAKSLLLFNAGDPVRQNDDAATATYQSYTINNSLNQYRMYISGITGTFVANAGKYVIGPEVLSGDAAVDPSGVNFLGSTFASSDGSLVAGSADWQVTTLADTGYSSIVSQVSQHPDMTDPQPKWTSGELEDETEYRARTKYYAASGEESPWSEDVTFKTASDTIVVAKPSKWRVSVGDSIDPVDSVLAADGDPLLTALAMGYSTITALDLSGTIYNPVTQANLPASAGPTKGIAQVGISYSAGWAAIGTNGELYYKSSTTSNIDTSAPIADNVTLITSNGTNNLGVIKEGKLFTIGKETQIPGFSSYVDETTLQSANVVLPDEDAIKYAVPCRIRSSKATGYILLTKQGKLYRIGEVLALNGFTDNIHTATPKDITPDGVKFRKLGAGFTAGGSPPTGGFYATTDDGKVYGFNTLPITKDIPQSDYSEPINRIPTLTGVIQMCSQFPSEYAKTVMNTTEGIFVCYYKVSPGVGSNDWIKVSNDAFWELGDYIGSFAYNGRGTNTHAYPLGPTS